MKSHPDEKRALGVEEISVAEDGRLLIRPAEADPIFGMIYRAAAEVRWEDSLRSFTCPKPREWSYADWFTYAAAAIHSELGRDLVLTPRTRWTNVPDAARGRAG